LAEVVLSENEIEALKISIEIKTASRKAFCARFSSVIMERHIMIMVIPLNFIN